MGNQKKIILYPNAEHDIGFETSKKVCDILRNFGRNVAFCPVLSEDYPDCAPLSGIKPSDLRDELPDAEMIVTLGGDGTILHAARIAAGAGVPILGINMGGKGFLTELEIEDIALIGAAAKGEYRIGSRMMLDVEVKRGGEAVCKDRALNDIVIRGDSKVIELTLLGDGQRISHFSGDGAIIATPTGSTAYSMSAGGPIVEPAAQNIIVTPICAHVLEARSFVLVSDRRVSVEIGYRKHNPAYMSVDGCEQVDIQSGDVVNARKSRESTRFVRLSNRSFYKKVSEKLGEKGRVGH